MIEKSQNKYESNISLKHNYHKMKMLVLFVALFSAAFAFNLRSRAYYEKNFEMFRRTFHKEYSSLEEHNYRLSVFANNLDIINALNKQKSSWTAGINKFTDMTPEEFRTSKLYLGELSVPRHRIPVRYIKHEPIPESIDWTTKGVVNEVVNQKSCGACYAFSGIAAIESLVAINTTKLIKLSAQQIVDCSGDYGNHGCNGGLRDHVMDYVIDNGICSEEDYPYIAKDQECKTCTPVPYAKISSHYQTDGSEDSLLQVLSKQPVSVGIFADTIMYYISGIFDHGCTGSINHGVLAVGYGVENGTKYIKIQNSWGKDWGEDGYIRLIGGVNECSVAERVHVPVM